MRTTRRRFLAAASATATAVAAPALAQSKETEAAGFEEALRAKFAAGDVLDGDLDAFMAAALSQRVTGEKVDVEDVE